VDTVPSDLTLSGLLDVLSDSRHHGLPVLNQQAELWGIVTVSDVDQAVAQDMSRTTTVAKIGTPRQQLLVAYPDETIGEALARMAPRGLGRLPVVARDAPNRLLGMLRRADIIRAYNVALSRRAKLQHQTQRMRLRHLDGTEFVDLTLKTDDKAVGRSVQEISGTMPESCILISIRRDGRLLIPHGDSIFQPGDHITAFIRNKDTEALYHCLLAEEKEAKSNDGR
jgi:CIC family chloride channel protein